MNFIFGCFGPRWRRCLICLIHKSVAPDGVLRIRIYALGKAANRLMEEGFFKLFQGIVRFFPSACAGQIQGDSTINIGQGDLCFDRLSDCIPLIDPHHGEHQIRGVAGGRRKGLDSVLTDRISLVEFQVHLHARTHKESG